MKVAMTINGTKQEHEVEPRVLLAQYIRDSAGLTGTNVGCDTTSCGACTVLLDGESVKSCTVLAVQADGAAITTIEGLATGSTLHPMQEAFRENHALQCGFCTPGMVMAALGLLQENPHPTEQEVRDGLGGQPVPLHRLPQHRQGHLGRGRVGGDGMTAVVGTPLRRKEDPKLLTGEARYVDDLAVPGALHASLVRSPYAHATINSVDVSRGPGRPRRGGRLQRRRPALGVGRSHAVRLAGDRGHEEPRAPAPRRDHRLLRGRRGGRGGGRDRKCRPGRGRAGGGRLRHPPRGHRLGGRPVGPGAGARGAGHQPLLHLGADPQPRGGGGGLRPGGPHRDRALHPAAAHPRRHGDPRRGRGPGGVRRRVHPLHRHPDPPHPEGPGRAHPRHLRDQAAGGGARRWAAGSVPSSTCTPRSCCAWPWPAGWAGRCAGARSASRTPTPPSTAGARSSTSSWPPTPTAR